MGTPTPVALLLTHMEVNGGVPGAGKRATDRLRIGSLLAYYYTLITEYGEEAAMTVGI